jgi:hypothetical protein
MYKDVESELIATGLAEKPDTPIWMDEKGIQVEDENKAIGMKVQTHYCLFTTNVVSFM